MQYRVNTPSHNTTVRGIDDFNIQPATGDLYLKNETAGTVGYVPSGSLEGWFDDDRVVS